MRLRVDALTFAALKISTIQVAAAALLALAVSGCKPSAGKDGATAYVPRPAGTVTFTKDIAPILFQHCAECHRPGESAPFPLLAYEDARKRARQIAEVTRDRTMPPWLPNPELVHFIGERRLTAEQIGLIGQWAAEGAPEGEAKNLPPAPQWNERWRLGEPDVVVKPARPFVLPADGKDLYRILVIQIPLAQRRYVRGIEFRANSRAVHHAFLNFDKTGQVRSLDGKDGQPGFDGLHTPKAAESPITFASWQPGKTPRFYPSDLAWLMETNTDLVLQLHLQPTGKEEIVAPEIAFYFTDQPGTAVAFKLPLTSYAMEIPPGATNYSVGDSFVLPVDVEVRAVLPHAHYLCRRVKAYADLPDGSRQWLMAIDDWNFDWQGDYQFVQPVRLPKGTKLAMEFTYDNSTNNARNPYHPPQLVRYGMNSSDEMAEVWLQIVLGSPADLETLTRTIQPRLLADVITTSEMLLRQNPRDARAHTDIGSALLMMGRNAEALQRLQLAVQLDPNFDEANYFVGLAYRVTKQLDLAHQAFERALQLNPRHARARGNLGLVLAEQGNLAGAAQQFEMALQLNPQDEIARDMLQRIRQASGGR